MLTHHPSNSTPRWGGERGGPVRRGRPDQPSIDAHADPSSGSRNGFTLVELLVTLVILGLASAAVVLAMPDPRGELRDESERLAARLAAARDAAIVGGRDMAVRLDAAGYRFETRRGGAWMPAEGRAFAARRWPEGTAVATVPPTARVTFDVTGLATPAIVQLSRDGVATRITVEAAGAVRIDAG